MIKIPYIQIMIVCSKIKEDARETLSHILKSQLK